MIQSGKSIHYHGPISKKGNRYDRKILFSCNRSIITFSATHDKENPMYIYDQKKKQKDKHFYACFTICSTKLILTFYKI